MGRNFLPLESHPLVTSVASMELQDGRASIKITFKGKCTASPIRYLSPPASRRYFFRDSASSLFAQITELKLKANVGHAIPRIAAFEILGQLKFVRCFEEEVFKFFYLSPSPVSVLSAPCSRLETTRVILWGSRSLHV